MYTLPRYYIVCLFVQWFRCFHVLFTFFLHFSHTQSWKLNSLAPYALLILVYHSLSITIVSVCLSLPDWLINEYINIGVGGKSERHEWLYTHPNICLTQLYLVGSLTISLTGFHVLLDIFLPNHSDLCPSDWLSFSLSLWKNPRLLGHFYLEAMINLKSHLNL